MTSDDAERLLANARAILAECREILDRPECRPGTRLWEDTLERLRAASRIEGRVEPKSPPGVVSAPDTFHPDGTGV